MELTGTDTDSPDGHTLRYIRSRVREQLKGPVYRMLHRHGYDLVKSLDDSDLLRRRVRLITRNDISVVFDIGANIGQFASTIRSAGFDGRIVSFEPLTSAFAQLKRASALDTAWEISSLAVGREEGEADLRISHNSTSSSLLDMLPVHLAAAPESAYVGSERVKVVRLDTLVREHVSAGDRLFVKIDAQGFEGDVLDGAGNAIDDVLGLQIELSLVPLYQGQVLYDIMLDRIRGFGFSLMSLEPGFWNRETGQLLQVDGIFFRSNCSGG